MQSKNASSVLFVGNYLSPLPGVRPVGDLIVSGLRSRGWEVYTTSAVSSRFFRLVDMLRTVWSHRHDCSAAQVDLFSGKAFFWGYCSCLLLRLLRKPFIISLHGGNLPSFSKRHGRVVRGTLRMAAATTAPSPFLADAMRDYSKGIAVLRNPVDLDAFQWRKRTRFSPSIIWVRAFHSVYDPATAIRVVGRLKKEFPDVRLTMLGRDKGDGSWQEAHRLIKDLGLEELVSMTGGVDPDDVPTYLQNNDIFLNTSTVDNAPVSMIEALACGLPVVSTNVGGIPETGE